MEEFLDANYDYLSWDEDCGGLWVYGFQQNILDNMPALLEFAGEKLKQLDLYGDYGSDDPQDWCPPDRLKVVFDNLTAKCPNLEMFTLEGEGGTAESAAELAKLGQFKVKTVHLSGMKLPSEVWSSVIEALPGTLIDVSFEGCNLSGDNDAALKGLAQKMAGNENLCFNVSRNPGVNLDAVLAPFGDAKTQFESLYTDHMGGYDVGALLKKGCKIMYLYMRSAVLPEQKGKLSAADAVKALQAIKDNPGAVTGFQFDCAAQDGCKPVLEWLDKNISALGAAGTNVYCCAIGGGVVDESRGMGAGVTKELVDAYSSKFLEWGNAEVYHDVSFETFPPVPKFEGLESTIPLLPLWIKPGTNKVVDLSGTASLNREMAAFSMEQLENLKNNAETICIVADACSSLLWQEIGPDGFVRQFPPEKTIYVIVTPTGHADPVMGGPATTVLNLAARSTSGRLPGGRLAFVERASWYGNPEGRIELLTQLAARQAPVMFFPDGEKTHAKIAKLMKAAKNMVETRAYFQYPIGEGAEETDILGGLDGFGALLEEAGEEGKKPFDPGFAVPFPDLGSVGFYPPRPKRVVGFGPAGRALGTQVAKQAGVEFREGKGMEMAEDSFLHTERFYFIDGCQEPKNAYNMICQVRETAWCEPVVGGLILSDDPAQWWKAAPLMHILIENSDFIFFLTQSDAKGNQTVLDALAAIASSPGSMRNLGTHLVCFPRMHFGFLSDRKKVLFSWDGHDFSLTSAKNLLGSVSYGRRMQGVEKKHYTRGGKCVSIPLPNMVVPGGTKTNNKGAAIVHMLNGCCAVLKKMVEHLEFEKKDEMMKLYGMTDDWEFTDSEANVRDLLSEYEQYDAYETDMNEPVEEELPVEE
uniref:Uncharacterized protein n=1 Tax=Chromera velia CCMP2878 TaxID=1169474 RepID=A0A0G4I5K3_9ALVE|eukprot:Cvel_11194.t1-p1 / transcript=Cvel_11194.t1 / gene=Cvel_11194 / organism=Chromera_velia_CCMP2878 / gene_product=hypothetical protein / transcript_product=hypothetical protein / location=Cvel_scaffold695:53945-65597(-) / protein_length=866 / sequence_SO=supercontig / SO=protein_coding / is_pseudo=false